MQPGDQLAPFVVEAVSPEKMKILAAILRDANVIHIDRELIKERGLGDKVINQGPTNMGYVTTMLEQNFGPGTLARLTIRFGANVFEGDTVTAGGTVTEVTDDTVTCNVWLDRENGERAVSGTAVMRVSAV
jgi:acyl dehydratase